jgi:hypothetical protein
LKSSSAGGWRVNDCPRYELAFNGVDVLPTGISWDDITAVSDIVPPIDTFLDEVIVYPWEFLLARLHQATKEDAPTLKVRFISQLWKHLIQDGKRLNKRKVVREVRNVNLSRSPLCE